MFEPKRLWYFGEFYWDLITNLNLVLVVRVALAARFLDSN